MKIVSFQSIVSAIFSLFACTARMMTPSKIHRKLFLLDFGSERYYGFMNNKNTKLRQRATRAAFLDRVMAFLDRVRF